MIRRWVAAAGVILIAVLLAFPLREAMHQTIVVPAAYVLWVVGLWYRSLSQGIWWIVVSVLVLLVVGRSLLPLLRPGAKVLSHPRAVRGRVEDLAGWLNRADHGTYFKWLIAHRLGKLAYQILLQRESGKPRSVFEPLTGPDWDPSPELQAYLHAGLHHSFADFPRPRRLFVPPEKTALDVNVEEAVDFLELQLDESHQR